MTCFALSECLSRCLLTLSCLTGIIDACVCALKWRSRYDTPEKAAGPHGLGKSCCLNSSRWEIGPISTIIWTLNAALQLFQFMVAVEIELASKSELYTRDGDQ